MPKGKKSSGTTENIASLKVPSINFSLLRKWWILLFAVQKMLWKFGITWQMIFLPCFTSAKDALSDLYGVLQLRKQLEDQCFPSVLLIKKLTTTLQELGNSLKLIDLKF